MKPILLLTIVLCPLPSMAAPIDFAHDVAPILKARCVRCHGNGKSEGELSIDSRERLLQAETIIPGDPDASELIVRVTSNDADLRMPPEGERLSDEEIATLRSWINEDAKWEPGFTFRGRGRVPIAPRAVILPPVIEDRDHPIDRIVDAYWAEQGVSRPQALSDEKFARRAYLDLIGLLPTPVELNRFLADDRPDKQSQLIDELLTRELDYADHWLTFWNDLLRNDYAGTGFIDGGRKKITPWLHRSLQENKPYDVFVRELLSPTAESEGFIYGIKWRGRVNASQAREVQFAQNVGQVFLGINLKCASCHDSFIDDWTLEESYSLAAIVSEHPLEIHRCDKPTGKMAVAASPFPELGVIDPAAPKVERLKVLANMLTSEQNGRLTRTIVNRLWERMMGRGIVHPVDVMDNPPWSADLLDFLANDLVKHDYNLKRTLSLIGSSTTYRLRSVRLTGALPTEGYVFSGPVAKQMTAEQFLDAVWLLTHTGPTRANAQVGSRGNAPIRASLVVSNPLMRSLGRPNREQVVTTRPGGLTTLQALDLSNGERLTSTLSRAAATLKTIDETFRTVNADWSRDQFIDWMYRSTVSRRPTDSERAITHEILADPPTPSQIADLLWSLILLPEFQLVE